MTRFLEKIADLLSKDYGTSLSDLCIVLPNRRGGLFLKKYLSSAIGRTIWSPDIFSVEDFLAGSTGLSIAENTLVLFELYEVHKEIEGKQAQPFEEFITWGQQLVHDFNEVDSYLADPGELFGFLSEARAISLWNLDQQPLTDFQQNYLRFYNSLYTYYTRLSERLIPGKQVYPGLLFRLAAEKFASGSIDLPWIRIIFAGFNALTKAEESIIDEIVSSGKAELIWDADAYYMDGKTQEAGEFLRNWSGKWGDKDFKWIGNDLSSLPKNITVTGIPFNIGQVKFCGELLSEIPGVADSPEDTAVVLMDEQLLVPLLNSLPENINALNITMGMSLKDSPLFSFFEALFQIHENRIRFQRSSSDGKIRFYFRDVLRILEHPSMVLMAYQQAGDNRFAYDEMVDMIRGGSRIFLARDEIQPVFSDLFSHDLDFLEPVFDSVINPADAVRCMKKVILRMRDSFILHSDELPGDETTRQPEIELEFIYGFSRIIHQVETLMAKYDSVKDLKTLHLLFMRMAENTTLPFYGEPLKGIQIMGMLETRTLDFKNLIMLSVNEDLIPSSKTVGSFIPYDIRRAFHLPTYQHKNAVYAYHFYRLLQRSENINLIYITEPDDLGGGEKSRFIKQIRNELPTVNPGIHFTDQILSVPPVTGQDFPPIAVEKNDDILALLSEKAARGFSPTSLNSYRRCRLRFYFSDIAGLEEDKELEETIDPQVLGQSVHDVLNRLYKPFVNQPLTAANIDSMFPLVGTLIDRAFEKKFKGSDVSYGKNLLLVNVAKIMIRNFLAEERRNIEKYSEGGISMVVKLLEMPLAKSLMLKLSDHITEINLKGFVDRVDLLGNRIRIIDYKTGQADKKDVELKEWGDLLEDPEKDKCFQLLMYAYILEDTFGISNPLLEAGIISLKKVKAGIFRFTVSDGNNEDKNIIDNLTLKNFEDILSGMLKEIFDPFIPFDQTGNREICQKCPYINLCGR